eukprot:735060-Hanusia_phi.AAC.1
MNLEDLFLEVFGTSHIRPIKDARREKKELEDSHGASRAIESVRAAIGFVPKAPEEATEQGSVRLERTKEEDMLATMLRDAGRRRAGGEEGNLLDMDSFDAPEQEGGSSRLRSKLMRAAKVVQGVRAFEGSA